MVSVTPICAFSDNYIWAVVGERKACATKPCAVIDPGDATPVLAFLQQYDLALTQIFLTHHHADHIGGVRRLLEQYSATVYGPADPRMPAGTMPLAEGDEVALLGAPYRVIEVPAHTRSHIAYYGEGRLFCGDTLFSVGCGRLFEGSAADMQRALDKLAALPDDTLVYCAHEYTASNCRFATLVEPGNIALQQRTEAVERLRRRGEPTLPSTIGQEKATNPFMRTREIGVRQAAAAHDRSAHEPAEVLAVIRQWKDRC